jgi:hypothetical protein
LTVTSTSASDDDASCATITTSETERQRINDETLELPIKGRPPIDGAADNILTKDSFVRHLGCYRV